MKIQVKQHWDLGEPVTVFGGYVEDGDFVEEWCNHAGAYKDEMPCSCLGKCSCTILVCDHCGATCNLLLGEQVSDWSYEY